MRVIGAASIGVLRAAELSTCGMVGVGEVFRSYASGAVEGDDEVAVGQLDGGDPRSVTWPLVNLRQVLEFAVAVGTITQEKAGGVFEELRAVYYPHRSLTAVVVTSRRLGAEEFGLWLKARLAEDAHFGDVKRSDALQALNVALELDGTPAPPAVSGWTSALGPALAALDGGLWAARTENQRVYVARHATGSTWNASEEVKHSQCPNFKALSAPALSHMQGHLGVDVRGDDNLLHSFTQNAHPGAAYRWDIWNVGFRSQHAPTVHHATNYEWFAHVGGSGRGALLSWRDSGTATAGRGVLPRPSMKPQPRWPPPSSPPTSAASTASTTPDKSPCPALPRIVPHPARHRRLLVRRGLGCLVLERRGGQGDAVRSDVLGHGHKQ